jgi:predicted lipoprotein with Yx(FWY)xxD motif
MSIGTEGRGATTTRSGLARLDLKRLALRLVGAGLLIATGGIHLDLYLTGYRTIPTIGWLFLLQIISAFALGLLVLVTSSRVVAALGAGFALATLGGYLLSLWVGLFGFREVRTTVGIVTAIIEIVAFAVLAALACYPAGQDEPAGPGIPGPPRFERLLAGIPGAGWAVATLSVLAAALLVAALATAGPASSSGGTSTALLKVGDVHGQMVVTNAEGYTLYWFVPDSATKSTCYGTCAAYWPPVTGTPAAGPGVTGKIGTITRSDGQTQVTYDRHPLYTYVGDSAPGQENGNAINLNGGLWYAIKP